MMDSGKNSTSDPAAADEGKPDASAGTSQTNSVAEAAAAGLDTGAGGTAPAVVSPETLAPASAPSQTVAVQAKPAGRAKKAPRARKAATEKASADEPADDNPLAAEIVLSDGLTIAGNRAILWRMLEKGATEQELVDATSMQSAVRTVHMIAGEAGRRIDVVKADGVKTYRLAKAK